MQRKEKRDILLSMLLGDGCLAMSSNKRSCGITIQHAENQKDYLEFKAKYLEKAFDRQVNIRHAPKNCCQISLHKKRFKAWRKFIYRNNKKDIANILPFIINPERAVAFWLMDDGYVEPSYSTLADGSKKLYGGFLRLFSCDQSLETHQVIIEWFYKHFDCTPTVKWSKNSKTNKTYPFLKFNQKDSLKIWERIRDFVLLLDSMKYKFRNIEETYQKRLSQRKTG